ncbi:putative serine protease 45 isoform X2 [Macrotis lagotis]|uniref:putative serine protease 45 isoform X2 n=1 Tax=Macrotis lagotis TaxID=92651 RepID=UPI003D69AE57
MAKAARGPRGGRTGLGAVGGRARGAGRMLGAPPRLLLPLLPLLLLLPTGCAAEEHLNQDEIDCGHQYLNHKDIVAEDEIPMKWPWQVSIQEGKNHLCGGSVIAPRWILTTANCVNRNITFNVLMGSSKLSETNDTNALRVPVKKVVIHSNYQSSRYWTWIGHENNIALLKLVHRVNYTKYITPVCLAPSKMEVRSGSLCWVTGWGQTSIGKKKHKEQLSPVLQQAEITIMSNDDCDTAYHDVSKVSSIVRIISDTMLCSYYSRGGDFCFGDYGGPLVCELNGRWFQTGIVSWTLGCSHKETPGVYTRISKYSNWIARELAELSSVDSTLKATSWITPLALMLPICLMMAL